MTPLVVVDPLRLAPIFAALTEGYSEKRKREAAIRGTVLGTVVLLIFALAGNVLLEALGISIPAFQIAGGILLFLLALDMIFASPTGLRSRTVREQEEISYENGVSVFPFAIPLLAGPGAITTVLLYSGERSATELVAFVAVLLAVLLLTLASLLGPRISCGSSARPDLTSLRGCSASSSRPWPFGLSSTAEGRASRKEKLSSFSDQLSAGKRAFILCSMAHGPIVLVGGLAFWPRRYRRFAQILREISGSEVHVAPITPLDWLLGRFRGYGQLVFEVASAVDRALLESDSGKAVLVGHSAGGIACRVYIGGDPPYGGRRYSGHRRVSHLITLGSPHVVADKKSLAPIAQVNDLFPGALHEPAGLRYISVAGGAADGKTSSRTRKRYERLVGDGRVNGDGVVPVESALLPASETLIFDDLYHSEYFGRWYGSDRETIERWWPEELRASGSLVGKRHA